MKLMATAAAAQHPPELVSYCWLVLVILQHVAICTHFVDSGGRCCHFWGNCRPWTSCAFVDDKRLLHFYERYMHRVAPGTRASGSHLNGNSETEMPKNSSEYERPRIRMRTGNCHHIFCCSCECYCYSSCSLSTLTAFFFFFLGLLFLIRICQRIFGLLSVDAQYTDDKMFFSIRASAKWEDKGYGTITSRSFIWNSNQVSCFFYTFHWRCLVYNFVPIGHPFFDSRWCVVVLIHDGNEHITRSLSGVWVTK